MVLGIKIKKLNKNKNYKTFAKDLFVLSSNTILNYKNQKNYWVQGIAIFEFIWMWLIFKKYIFYYENVSVWAGIDRILYIIYYCIEQENKLREVANRDLLWKQYTRSQQRNANKNSFKNIMLLYRY